MGNALGCIAPAEVKRKSKTRPPPPPHRSPLLASFSDKLSFTSSGRRTKERSVDHLLDDPSLSHEQQQALAAAALFLHHRQTNYGSLPFSRSTSVVCPSPATSKRQSFNRSSSSRQRLHTDPVPRTHQLIDQGENIDGLETKHFVLVHGGGFGAWCWYKTMTLLQENGFEVDAVDLTGSGVSPFDPNNITSLAQYVKPLTDVLDKLEDGKKVILVGHDLGGACVSYVMELFPHKIAQAVFIAAAMLSSGQSILDMFSQQADSNYLMRQAQKFLHANQPPTAIDLDKACLKELMFHQTSTKDFALATVSMRAIPFAPVLEKLSLSDKNYGSVRRVYVKTMEDQAIPVSVQEAMIDSNPAEEVFQLKGSDHAPFFSKPLGLHKILVRIAHIPPKHV